MNKNQVEGKLKKAEGQVQEKWGQVTNDPKDKAKGKMKQGEGAVQEVVGDVEEAVKSDR